MIPSNHQIQSENREAPLDQWVFRGVTVRVGTSRDVGMAQRITSMVNRAYYESMKEHLDEDQESYERVDAPEVRQRLAMGDDGPFANRVLLLGFVHDELIGCISSTYQPPWTPDGCGHWGLLVVDLAHQNKRYATALVQAAERRVAGACNKVQMEFTFTPGNEHDQRMKEW
eukprot:TRINITY_DN4967_c0_g1_i5.p2 TRINITY_DN4967_c0_g1~~TRINITY_DN4967_c0_g1_i5.p2  ORF type:complete len:171 (+),score=28.59 TRINITY_DN4967_c0_g1_i5:149-661(+)